MTPAAHGETVENPLLRTVYKERENIPADKYANQKSAGQNSTLQRASHTKPSKLTTLRPSIKLLGLCQGSTALG